MFLRHLLNWYNNSLFIQLRKLKSKQKVGVISTVGRFLKSLHRILNIARILQAGRLITSQQLQITYEYTKKRKTIDTMKKQI